MSETPQDTAPHSAAPGADDDFFGLTPTHNPHRWYLPVTERLAVGPPGMTFLFGGVGLAAGLAAMERTTGRPAIWGTAQYLSYARPPEIVDIDVLVPASGKYNSQARAIGHVGDREIFTVNAALGARGDLHPGQWARMPEVPAPLDCPEMPRWPVKGLSLHDNFEERVAEGRYGPDREGPPSPSGRTLFWVRPKGGRRIDTAMLAIIADFLPGGIGDAIGKQAGGNSLDNTLRICRVVETGWVLCDRQIHAVQGGFAHGRMHLFAEDGTLMATASQSMILRVWDEARAKNLRDKAAERE